MQVFSKRLQIAYNKSFPLKRLSGKRAKDKPWITYSRAKTEYKAETSIVSTVRI